MTLKPRALEHGPPGESAGRRAARLADWAAQYFRTAVYGKKSAYLDVLEADRDICGLLLSWMGMNQEQWRAFCSYLADDKRFFREGKEGGNRPWTYWHRHPRLLVEQFWFWWSNGKPKRRSTASYQTPDDTPHHDECLGCFFSGQEDATSEPRRPGEAHRKGCWYRRLGGLATVGPDDWRLTRYAEFLQKHEEKT